MKINHQELHEICKSMPEDPRLGSASNNDTVLYNYPSFVFGNNDHTDATKLKYHYNRCR